MSARSILAAWADLWRSAPREDRRDLLRLLIWTPTIVQCFAILWMMVP